MARSSRARSRGATRPRRSSPVSPRRMPAAYAGRHRVRLCRGRRRPAFFRSEDGEAHRPASRSLAMSRPSGTSIVAGQTPAAGHRDVPAGGGLHRRARRGARSSSRSSTRSATPASAARSSTSSASRTSGASSQSPSFRKAIRNSIVFTVSRPGDRDRVLDDPLDRAREAVPRPRPRAFPDPPAVGRARVARDDRLEVDPRLDLQRDHVGARRAPRLQAVRRPDVARRAAPRDGVRHPRPLLAADSVLDRDHPGGPVRDPEGDPGGGRDRRRRLLAHSCSRSTFR